MMYISPRLTPLPLTLPSSFYVSILSISKQTSSRTTMLLGLMERDGISIRDTAKVGHLSILSNLSKQINIPCCYISTNNVFDSPTYPNES